MGLSDRIGRLEARAGPSRMRTGPHEMSPLMSSLLKDIDAQRREMDGLEPDPQNEVRTPAEEAADREATRNFLPYLEGEWERASPDNRESIERLITMTRADIAALDLEQGDEA